MIKRFTSKPDKPYPRLSYGIVVYDDGKHKHQRYFTKYCRYEGGVEVELVSGDVVYVKEKEIIRYPEVKEVST
jgi:hypothetical protein